MTVPGTANATANGARHAAQLPLSLISINGGTQSRDHISEDVVDDYAAALGRGATFPPVVVFYDGTDHWLADGFHRYRAFTKIGRSSIDADIRQGTRRDAILYSVGANEEHGLRRTIDDKRRAVMALLGDAEWSAWSDNQIAKACRVSQPFVSKHRGLTSNVISERRVTTKHGTATTMQTAAIGKSRAPKEPTRQVRRDTSAAYSQDTPDMRDDPDARAVAEEQSRDDEVEAAEIISQAGADELVTELKKLRTQIEGQDRVIARLTTDNGKLTRDIEFYKKSARTWEKRAREAGWKDA